MRYGRKLGLNDLFLADVCAEVVALMGHAYPEIKEKAAVVKAVVTQEEKRFGRTLDAGCKRLEEAFSSNAKSKVVPGEVAFELCDTHGFPLDLTQQAASERGFTVDTDGFEACMERQREMGRASWVSSTTEDSVWEAIREEKGRVTFTGYEQDSAAGTVIAVIDDGQAIVTDCTPFYAESGGQVGDTGTISKKGASFAVSATRAPIEGIVVHFGESTSGEFEVGDAVQLSVNAEQRNLTRKNHSATHLLHFALRHVLGLHVKQRGSLVGPNRLRFDFSHFDQMTTEELQSVEMAVNERILQNVAVQTDVVSKDEAADRGAIAFFGDKYGEEVRVLTITEDSVELCGGTHVQATGDIGLFKILGESSIASGVRRIEAVTGLDALKHVHGIENQIAAVADSMNSSVAEMPIRLQKLQEDHSALQKEFEALRAQQRSAGLDESETVEVGGISLLAMELEGVKGGDLRDLSDKARQRLGSGVVFLASKNGSKVALLVAVTDDVKDRFPAGKLVSELAPLVGGRGGGRPELAQAGGNDPSKIGDAMARLKEILEQGELK
jgi:alanyl-tRNA synthetase